MKSHGCYYFEIVLYNRLSKLYCIRFPSFLSKQSVNVSLKCLIYMYIYLFTSSKEQRSIVDRLQGDLDSLKIWCQHNKLTINAEKTKLIVFGNKKLRDKVGDISVTFDGKPVEEVSQYKYLGVKLDQT